MLDSKPAPYIKLGLKSIKNFSRKGGKVDVEKYSINSELGIRARTGGKRIRER
jgi:hypothetical protein